MPRCRLLTALALSALMLLAAPALASAAEKSRAATGTYDLDFTLPTVGKSGCLVCHEDRNLVRVKDGETRSMYVDVNMLKTSAHASVPCTKCHLDFAFKAPHKNAADDRSWRLIAKMSCQGSQCHSNKFTEVNEGAHTNAVKFKKDGTPIAPKDKPDGKKVPLCGDCHGGHEIRVLKDNPAGRAALQGQGIKMCGECHPEESATYNDYYHGAAYRKGAPDAPACWDCHGAHKMMASDQRFSPTNPVNLPETCGACHKDANEEYTQYAKFVHGRSLVLAENPAWSFMAEVRQRIQGAIEHVKSLFGA